MLCPKCNIALSRHDNWCSKCGTYYGGQAAAPTRPASPAAPASQPWSAPTQPPTYTPPAYTPPPRAFAPKPAPNRHEHNGGGGRFMIGGVGISTIVLVLRLANVGFHAYEIGHRNGEQDAANNQQPNISSSVTYGNAPDPADGVRQTQADNAAAMQNAQAQAMQSQQQMRQMQAQQQLQMQQNLQAQQQSMRSMSPPAFSGPPPMMRPPSFSPMGAMGGSRFGRP